MSLSVAELIIIFNSLFKWDSMIAPNMHNQQYYAIFEKFIEKWEAES